MRARVGFTICVLFAGALAPLLGVSCDANVQSAEARDSGADSEASAFDFPESSPETRAACIRKSQALAAGIFASDPPQREAQRSSFERACIAEAVAPGSSITAEHIDRCASALVGRDPCLRHAPLECVAPAGTLPLGAECVTGHQCASGACSEIGAISKCGVCVAASKVGDACTHECGLGLECRELVRPQCPTGRCPRGFSRCEVPARDTETFTATAESGELGEACITDYGCKRRLRCVEGKCAGGRVGDACGPKVDPICGRGLHCDCDEKKCVEGAPAGVDCAASDIVYDPSDASCRAKSAPACAPCKVLAIAEACGGGSGTYGTPLPKDPACDRAAACGSTTCNPRRPCTGVCRPFDAYWCSRN